MILAFYLMSGRLKQRVLQQMLQNLEIELSVYGQNTYDIIKLL